MPETLISPDRGAVVRSSAFLMAKISGLRRKLVMTHGLTGMAVAVGMGVEVLALVMFIDWCLDLAWWVRLVLFVAQTGLLGYVLLRLVAEPILRPPNDDELALMVERARTIFRSRLIASVQLSREGAIPPGASAAMVDAMVEETEAIAAPMDFNAVVSTEKLKKLGAVALLVAVLGIFGLIYGGRTSMDLLKRAFLSTAPVPRKTRITVRDGNKVIGRGDNVRLEAWVAGVIPGNGKVEIRYPGRQSQQFSLEEDRGNRQRFGRTIENVQDSFAYKFYLGDGESPSFNVKTIPRPTISSLTCEQEFPAYTRRQPTSRSLGDLSLLGGSRLHLKGVASKPIRAAALKFMGTPGNYDVFLISGFPPLLTRTKMSSEMMPLKLSEKNPSELSGSFTVPAQGLAGFSVLMLDSEGMESRDAAVYRVDTVPDKPPMVSVTYPERKEDLVTRQAVVPIAFEASDDFEIARVRLRYKADTLDAWAEKSVELDLEGQHPQRLKRRHEWNLSAFSPLLAEGSKIEYWIEAEDNNDVTGPGLGSSEHKFAKVVSESEKRADLLNRAGDYLGSIGDVANDQQKLNENLGDIIRAKLGK